MPGGHEDGKDAGEGDMGQEKGGEMGTVVSKGPSGRSEDIPLGEDKGVSGDPAIPHGRPAGLWASTGAFS